MRAGQREAVTFGAPNSSQTVSAFRRSHSCLTWPRIARPIMLLLLMQEGPKIGYHLELSKFYPQFLEEAKELFSSYGVQVVTGRKFLGGFIGNIEDSESWLQKKSRATCPNTPALIA